VRFDSVCVGPKDDPAIIRFHPQLTVVSGMASAERSQMFELLFGALTGASPEVREMHYVDNNGQIVQLVRTPSGVHFVNEDGRETPSPLTVLGIDPGGLRRLMLIQAADVGVARAAPASSDPELQSARNTLAVVEAEVAGALATRSKVDELRAEVALIDERLLQAEVGGARRRYARLLGELEKVRIEADSTRGGAAAAEADQRFVATAARVHHLGGQWHERKSHAQSERERFGGRERLDLRTLSEALLTPDQVPPELDALAAVYEGAEAKRSLLNERLNTLAADHLAEPSHPAVVRLAHADQELVWGTARQAIEAGKELESQSVALGGLEAEGVAHSAVADLETAHDAVDAAERVADSRYLPGMAGMGVGVALALASILFTPILTVLGAIIVIVAGLWALALPRRGLAGARANEQEVLKRAGVLSYMGFQFRRLEVTINPRATEPLEVAAMAYRRAMAVWRDFAGELLPAIALELEGETRAYAASLVGLRGAADHITEARRQLVEEAEPAVTAARQRLLNACAPFGITDPNLAVELVRHQAVTSSQARLQQELEQAEAAEAEVRDQLEQQLAEFGFTGGELSERLGAFDRAREEAQRREHARHEARPAGDVEADLTRLEALVDAARRPEWGEEITPADAEEPDVEDLRRRRQRANAEYTDVRRGLPDLERLADRRDALARRVAVLEGHSQNGGPVASIDAMDLEQLLMARMAAARRVGPSGETVPLVLDEPFEHIHGDRKWAILETLERLSSSVQLAYLTDDVDTIVWARRRAATGSISLLEPISEKV
jgi:hypothetical protein